MQLSKSLVVGGLAGATLMLSAAAALADPGYATGSVNVRTGPGTSYPVVDTLQRGEDVDIRRCTGGWCYVEHDGPPGWASASYLANDDARSAAPVYPPDYYEPPPVYIVPPPVYYPGYDHPNQRRPYYYRHRPGNPFPGHPGPGHNGPPPGHNGPPPDHNGPPPHATPPNNKPGAFFCPDPKLCQD